MKNTRRDMCEFEEILNVLAKQCGLELYLYFDLNTFIHYIYIWPINFRKLSTKYEARVHWYEVVDTPQRLAEVIIRNACDYFHMEYIGKEGVNTHVIQQKFAIKDVIFNPPATIVFWKDGSKTVVKCGENDIFDPEKGLAMAFAKKILGNKGSYYETFRKWLPGKNTNQKVRHNVLDAVLGDLDDALAKIKLPEFKIEWTNAKKKESNADASEHTCGTCFYANSKGECLIKDSFDCENHHRWAKR